MNTTLRNAFSLAIAAMLAIAAPGAGIAQDAKAKAGAGKGEVTTLQLSISKDGRALVDQNGKVVANFVKGTQVKPGESLVKSSGQTKAMQGCMRCTYDCVVYDGNRCIQRVRSCTWDFDC
jgi:hypothetical protein